MTAQRTLAEALADLQRARQATGKPISPPSARRPAAVAFVAVAADAYERQIEQRRIDLARLRTVEAVSLAIALRDGARDPSSGESERARRRRARKAFKQRQPPSAAPAPGATLSQRFGKALTPVHGSTAPGITLRQNSDEVIPPARRPAQRQPATRTPARPAPQPSPYAHLQGAPMAIWRWLADKVAVTAGMISEALGLTFSETMHNLRKLENNRIVRITLVGFTVEMLQSPPMAKGAA